MSAYKTGPSVYLLDANNQPQGMVGLDGREWAFPAALTAAGNAGQLLANLPVLFDPATFAPVGYVGLDGQEYIFPSALALNTTQGYRRGYSREMASGGAPVGVGGIRPAFSFPSALVPGGGGGGGAAPVVATAPQISQYAAVGQPISFTRGTYTGTVTSYTQQWLKGGVPIAGATGLTYTPIAGDNPSNISVKEVALNGASASADNISNGTIFATTGVFIGDSITVYTGASDSAHGWTSLYCAALGLTQLNKGLTGTLLQDSTYVTSSPGVGQASNGFGRFLADIQGANARQRIVIAYGFNDARYTGGTGADGSGTSVTLAAYQSELGRMVAGLICNGVRPLDIHIVSPYWMTDTGLGSGTTGFVMTTNLGSVAAARAQLQAFRDAAAAVATDYGTLYTDGYAALSGAGAGAIGGDNIHPNDTGHAAIAASAQVGAPLNSKPMPPSIAVARNGAGGMTVSWTSPAVPAGRTITNYTVEYGLKSAITLANRFVMTGTTSTSSLSQNFSSLADGWYVARVRANYDDSTSSPWKWFTTGQNIDSRTTDTTVSFTDFTTATVGVNVESITGWNKLVSTGSLTIGGAGVATLGYDTPEVIGGTIANQTDLYKGATQDFPGSGKLFNEQVWHYASSAGGNANTSVMLKSNSAVAANGILALYNDVSFRVFKLTAGALAAATGTTTGTVSLVPNLDFLVRLEISAGVQTIYLNNASISTASEPTGGSWGNEAGFRMANTSSVATDFAGTHIKSVRVGTTV